MEVKLFYLQAIGGVIVLLSIYILSGTVPALMGLDDNSEVLAKNWTTYVWLIIMSMLFFAVGLGSLYVIVFSAIHAKEFPIIDCELGLNKLICTMASVPDVSV
jgi:hypothetical protein